MEYKDFKIRLASVSEDRYRIIVESPMGSAESDLDLPFRLSDLEGLLRGVAETVRGDMATRDLQAVEEPGVSAGQQTGEFGVGLYRAVFRDTVQSMLDQCLGSVQSLPDTGLRIRLEMDLRSGRMANVASLPWELMRRGLHDVPLSVSKRTTVVRSFDVMKPADPIPFDPPLRVLVIVSNPGGTTPLKLAEEEARIRTTWGRLEDVEVTFVPPTIEALLDACASTNFHVIHYMGHGDFDPVTGQGILFLEKPDGSPDPLGAERLKAMFQDESDSLRLVFLNACKTAVSTERKGLDPFAGIATMLIDVGVPAVVAMQFPITDDAAITFSDTFYRRIVAGFPVDAAVSEGRKALWVAGNKHMEWATPVLFMRSRDGVLFKGNTKVTIEPIEVEPPPPPRPPEVTPAPERALQTLVGAAGARDSTWDRIKWLAIGGAGVLALALVAFVILVIRTPAFVTELRILSAGDTVYVGGDTEARMRVVADGTVYDNVRIAGLVPSAVRVIARSDSLVHAEFNDTTGTITVRGRRAGTGSFWAVGILPEGDSVLTERRSVRVVSAPDTILVAVNALEAAEDLDAGEADNATVLTGFEGVIGAYGTALAEAGRMDRTTKRIEELRALEAYRDSTDALARHDDLTLAQKLAADSTWLARSTEVRARGADHARIRERMNTLRSTMQSGGRVATLVVCQSAAGTHCAERPSATSLAAGRTAYVTVWYVGREPFTVQWLRDGQRVDSQSRRSEALNQAGYRVTFQRDVDAAGAWEVRVLNAAGSFVARQAFTVD